MPQHARDGCSRLSRLGILVYFGRPEHLKSKREWRANGLLLSCSRRCRRRLRRRRQTQIRRRLALQPLCIWPPAVTFMHARARSHLDSCRRYGCCRCCDGNFKYFGTRRHSAHAHFFARATQIRCAARILLLNRVAADKSRRRCGDLRSSLFLNLRLKFLRNFVRRKLARKVRRIVRRYEVQRSVADTE